MTICRVWDGINDPLCAIVFERINPKHGKIRIFMIIGWAICSFGLLLLYVIAAGRVDGVMGIVMFTLGYLLYDAGYTIRAVGAGTTAVVITNDPTQRPMTTAIGAVYSYGVPLILTNLVTLAILPKYDNQYNLPMMAETCLWFVAFSAVLLVIAVIGVWKVDKPETFEVLKLSEAGKKTRGEAEGKTEGNVRGAQGQPGYADAYHNRRVRQAGPADRFPADHQHAGKRRADRLLRRFSDGQQRESRRGNCIPLFWRIFHRQVGVRRRPPLSGLGSV